MQPRGLQDSYIVPQSLSDISAEVEHREAIPIDQHRFCKALYVREEREQANAQSQAGRKRCSVWGLGALSVVSALLIVGVVWLLRDYEPTPPPHEYHAIVGEFNGTDASRGNGTVTTAEGPPPERPLQSPEPWM